MRDDQRGPLPRPRRDRPPPEPGPEPVEQHAWLDQDAGPVVRPYTLTGGRSRPITGGLSLLTHVEALYAPEADLINLQPEHRAILTMTRTALSMAEIAARLDLPVGVVRVLIGDLLHENLVSTFESDTAVNPPDENILQAVIDGLRAL
jgi:DNA-directed RNA polymerase specialized sigma24 family protein